MGAARSRPGAREVRVEARAKLNLGLVVGPRRPDGFHDIATVFQSITLADTLVVTRRRSGFTLDVQFEDASARGDGPAREPLGPARENLVLRAAKRVAALAGVRGGAHFRLRKRIPSRSGMGGGSADAAAAIVAMNALYGLRLGLADRIALGADLGSDVPFAVLGGTALGLGRGERLTRLELTRPFAALVAVPRWRVSTSAAFNQIDRNKYGLTGWATKLGYARSFPGRRLKPEQALGLGNSFESVMGSRQSDFHSLRARMLAAGVVDACMTGSGSAVFGILGPGLSVRTVARRFAGNERIFFVRSARAGLRLTTLP